MTEDTEKKQRAGQYHPALCVSCSSTPKWSPKAKRMEHTTPNTPSDATFFSPAVDQWSAPEHAIAHVLAHARTTGSGSNATGGAVHLN